MPNSVDPDETARLEPSHLDLHSSNKYLRWSTGLKVLRVIDARSVGVGSNYVKIGSAPFCKAVYAKTKEICILIPFRVELCFYEKEFGSQKSCFPCKKWQKVYEMYTY